MEIPKGTSHVGRVSPLAYDQRPTFFKWGYDFTGPETGRVFYCWFIWTRNRWQKDTSMNRFPAEQTKMTLEEYLKGVN